MLTSLFEMLSMLIMNTHYCNSVYMISKHLVSPLLSVTEILASVAKSLLFLLLKSSLF